MMKRKGLRIKRRDGLDRTIDGAKQEGGIGHKQDEN
jgi:hypothetical protein